MKVRVLGYAAIVLEIVTVIIWVAASYGDGVVLLSVVGAASGVGGQADHLQNTTSGVSLTIPVKGAGFFPVTVKVSVTFLNGENQTVAQTQGDVTVSPAQIGNLTLDVPIKPGYSPSGYRVHGIFQISSLGNLLGLETETSISAENVAGGAYS
jgi:hypothetical protein